MNGRCCVFQPFDKGPFDKRYNEIIVPAIEAAELEPYRVDRDDGAVIPIETLHEEIRSATVCLADITTVNPNVMYELGFAIASLKDVVIICSRKPEQFPFDIQHRAIIQYDSDSVSDFEKLKAAITSKLKAALKKQDTTRDLASASPVKSTEGLQPNEVALLAFVMANVDGVGASVPAYTIKSDMENAGYAKVAANLGMTRLKRLGFVESSEITDDNYNTSVSYTLTSKGEDWLLGNQHRLEMRLPEKQPTQKRIAFSEGITDDDVPF